MIKKEIQCKICGSPRVVNKHFSLCNKHNKERLSDNKKNKTTSIIKKSEKQNNIDKKYTECINEIKQEREMKCESCGSYNKPLSFSHIISRKRCKEINREDLIYDKRNIIIECYEAPTSFPSACHNQWELRQLDKCKSHMTYDYKINFIANNDDEFFKSLLK